MLLEQLSGVSGGVIVFLLTSGADGVGKLGPERMNLQQGMREMWRLDGAWSSSLTCFLSRGPRLKGHKIGIPSPSQLRARAGSSPSRLGW